MNKKGRINYSPTQYILKYEDFNGKKKKDLIFKITVEIT